MATLDVKAIDARAAELLATEPDERARAELVEVAYPLVENLARRFSNRGETFEDLVQVASIGLLKAMKRFDPERGVRFSTYATPTILGEIKRYFRDSGWAMHLPRRLKERALLLRSAIEDLTHDLERSPTIPEIAAHTGLTPEEVLEGLDASSAYSVESLDAPRDDDPDSLGPSIGEHDWALELTDRWATVAPLLRALDERERRILYLRFVRGMTQSQIASQIGYSQMHVSRLLSKTLSHLREAAFVGHD